MPKTTLGLMAIFRNEADILKEFIDHHIKQGIDWFYLINNASEDNYEEIVNQYNNVTIFQEPHVANQGFFKEVGPQTHAYNKALPFVQTEWLYVCDVDEFIYGPSGYTLKSYIEKYGYLYDQFLISSKTFTSNGHIQQPKSVIKGFTERQSNEIYPHTKSCVRVSKVKELQITMHYLNYAGITTNTCRTILHHASNKKDLWDYISRFKDRKNNPMYDDPLVINHYTTMSKERFFKLKPNRGNASWEPHDGMSLLDFYEDKWNSVHSKLKNPCQDTELKDLYEKD